MSNYKGPYNSFSQNAEPIYNQSNILGTVSQSGGVPTGAIIERGSNANGEYVKYADGTLICTRAAVFDHTNTSAQAFDHAVQFVHSYLPSTSISAGETTGSGFEASVRIGHRSNRTSWQIRDFTGFFTADVVVVLSAIGRWY